ncbi:hypothetical protein BDN70DRAFT_154559 [Pholiota conissans]|uniref:DUF6534 domain-containing protein n=1 Tax=Pholiota conissans TaxID=109636 RepID=A0A9P6CRX4_9AGAR|nr:hypothetical protein BDN70DRAFT_154559 [Pholiota conissans]
MATLDGPYFQETFGAMLIGALVTMTIYGITTLQAYFYFMSFPKDGKATKMLVASIWILDTIHAIFMCHAVHFYLIDGFTNPVLLINGNWSLFLSIAINRYWIGGVIGIFVFAHFATGINTVVNLFITRRFVHLKDVSITSALPFGITVVISDILIAAALCILLSSKRSSFQDTNSIVNKLIIFAVNRCILTCAMAIVEIVAFTALPNSFYSIAIDFVIGKLYANSCLAVLNARATLRPENQDGLSSTELSTAFNFNITSAMANHQTSLIQVRSRDNFRDNSNTNADFEKGESSNFVATKRTIRSSIESGDRS